MNTQTLLFGAKNILLTVIGLERGKLNMRLIDVDELKLPRGFFEKVDNVPKFYEWLDTLPTVDAVPVRHGHWNERYDTRYHFECSICKYLHQYKDNYCPLCGAKMEAEDGKND